MADDNSDLTGLDGVRVALKKWPSDEIDKYSYLMEGWAYCTSNSKVILFSSNRYE